MDNHTKAVFKSRFYHIRSFHQIRSSLDDSGALSVAAALVSSRLEYANSMPFGLPIEVSFTAPTGSECCCYLSLRTPHFL